MQRHLASLHGIDSLLHFISDTDLPSGVTGTDDQIIEQRRLFGGRELAECLA